MLKVGITGGIGSGKTTVCGVFQTLGIPVFFADIEAKRLTEEDEDLISAVIALFGDAAYVDGAIDRAFIAAAAFKDSGLLQRLNAVVHPATIRYGRTWMAAQATPYAMKEAALFFESGSAAEMDVMIGVDAPEVQRIERVLRRGNSTRNDVVARIEKQMSRSEKMALCDFIILNDGQSALIPQVLQVHNALLRRAANPVGH